MATCSDFLVVGGVYLDELHIVPSYPAEDSTTRATAVLRRRGGNASTTACVLAQLIPQASTVHWMGVVPAPGQDDGAVKHVLDDMDAFGVDTALRETVEPTAGQSLGVPSANIIVSEASGSRTIISSRRGMREVSPEHFQMHGTRLASTCWVHLEGREYASVIQMAQQTSSGRLSVEIEKPSLSIEQVLDFASCAHLILFSRDWVETHAASLADGGPNTDRLALETLHVLAKRGSCEKRLPDYFVWVCAWGSHGAYAVEAAAHGDTRTYKFYFQPAVPVDRVVDSTGAGDTFNAAMIAALARGDAINDALGYACSVAGRKVRVGVAIAPWWMSDNSPTTL